MKLDSNSQLRGASLLLLIVPFFLLVVTINTSTCLASPVARPVPAEEKAVVEVEVEVEAENDDGTVAPKAAALVNKIFLPDTCIIVNCILTFFLSTRTELIMKTFRRSTQRERWYRGT